MNLSCPVNAADVGITDRAGHGGRVDTSLDQVAAEDALAGLPVREFRWYKGRRHVPDILLGAFGAMLVSSPQRHRARGRHPPVDQRAEQQPRAVCPDQDR